MREEFAAPTGIQVSDNEIASLPITRHRFHGDWNYTLHPQHPMDAATTDCPSDQAPTGRPPRLKRRSLQDPELTGMTRQQLSELINALSCCTGGSTRANHCVRMDREVRLAGQPPAHCRHLYRIR